MRPPSSRRKAKHRPGTVAAFDLRAGKGQDWPKEAKPVGLEVLV
jgi:hypothetical protein